VDEEKKPLYIAATIGDRLLGIVTGIVALALILYGAYVLYDNMYLSHKAFSSRDLLQYKPSPEATDETYGFSDILEINPDTVGWITIYDTNIDYPLMQGKDNLEYINKDAFGDFSLSGSIYIDSENDRELTDDYNIIYGHHMANGAMFGDIDKYRDRDFFLSHQDGLLQTPKGNFDLKVFAVLHTDAYNQAVYSLADRDDEARIQAMLEYIEQNSIWFDRESATSGKIIKLIALSTCEDADTNGRLLLFCSAFPRRLPIPTNEPEPEPPVKRTATGRGTGDKWALLDLVCTILTVLTLLPVTYIIKKYRQIGYSRRTAASLEELSPDDPLALRTAAEYGEGYIPGVVRSLKDFSHRMVFGAVIEAVAAIGAIVVFCLTQDIRNHMTLSDRWTPLFICIAAAALLTDYICFRYRGNKPPRADDPAPDPA